MVNTTESDRHRVRKVQKCAIFVKNDIRLFDRSDRNVEIHLLWGQLTSTVCLLSWNHCERFFKTKIIIKPPGFRNPFFSILLLIFEPLVLATFYRAHSKRNFKRRRLHTYRTRYRQPFGSEVNRRAANFYFFDSQNRKNSARTTDFDIFFTGNWTQCRQIRDRSSL